MNTANSLPPEIQIHQNRISVEVRELFIKTLKGKLTADTSSQIGRIMWSIVSDPVYESEEELKYLAAKIGTIVGHYDVAIKSLDENVPGSVVWGSYALFEVGEIEEAFGNLEKIIESEFGDNIPLVEAIVLYIYLRTLVGNTDGLGEYVEKLDLLLASRQSRLLPDNIKKLYVFAKGLVDIHSKSAMEGYDQIEEFYRYCKSIGDQFWQSLVLLILGEQRLDFSDFISAEKIYEECLDLATNLSNSVLIGAAKIGLAHVLYLKGELKQANFIVTQSIKELQEKSQYHLSSAYFIKGKILARLGQHTNARRNFSLAESFSRKYNDYNNTLLAMLELADNYFLVNEKKLAQETYKKAYAMITNIANKKQFTKALVQITIGDFYQGNYVKALEKINRIETLSEEIVYQKGKADAIKLRAQVNIQLNRDILKQIKALKAAQILYLEIGDEVSSVNCDTIIAKAYIKLGYSKDALVHLERAKSFYMKTSDNLMIAEIKEIQAEFDIKDGKYDEALVKLRSSYSHYSDIFDTSGKARCIRKIADTLALKGNFDDAIARYKKLRETIEKMDDKAASIIMYINLARSYLASENVEKAKEVYKETIKLMDQTNIKKYLTVVLKESIHSHLLQGDNDTVLTLLDELGLLAGENENEVSSYYFNFVRKMLEFYESDNEAYFKIMEYLQESIQNKDYLTSVFILLHVLDKEIEPIDEDIDEFKKAELENYIELVRSLTSDNNLFFLRGISFLLEVIWFYFTGNQNKIQETIVEASSFFSDKGFETLSNLLVEYQFNFSKWSGQTTTQLPLVTTPTVYENPKSMLLDIIKKAKYFLYVDRISETEYRIIKELNKKK